MMKLIVGFNLLSYSHCTSYTIALYSTYTYIDFVDNFSIMYLLYFAWADQRAQQFYNYHNVSSR